MNAPTPPTPEDQTIGYYTDTTLIHRWMAAELLAVRGGKTRWAKVRDTFLVGSTTAREICSRHGFDPEQKVKP
jgi:hypothetical protein